MTHLPPKMQAACRLHVQQPQTDPNLGPARLLHCTCTTISGNSEINGTIYNNFSTIFSSTKLCLIELTAKNRSFDIKMEHFVTL